jgi:hypothetical protein
MSNSSKQRLFIKNLIKELKTQGEQHDIIVSLEAGKHSKVILSSGSKSQSVTISSTPKNRSAAQRAALADIRRALSSLNPLAGSSFDAHGMLQMMSVSSSHDETLDPHKEINVNVLRESLKVDLNEFDVGKVLELVEIMLSMGPTIYRLDPDRLYGVGSSILIPSQPDYGYPISCQPLVGIRAAEKPLFGNYFTLKQAIDSLLAYYSRCSQIAKIGVIVTDVWRPSDINRFSFELDYWELNGVKTFFILFSGHNVHAVDRP